MPWGRPVLVCAATLAALAACQTNPTVEQETKALSLSQESLKSRALQSRRYETKDERKILAACSGVLQDLGFAITESSAKAGLIVAMKDRDAIEAGQVAGSIIASALIAALGGQADPTYDTKQKIRISIVTTPLPSGTTLVRATFQRVLWNNKNQLSRVETIDDPVIYQQFFDKLSQSIFLEGQKI